MMSSFVYRSTPRSSATLLHQFISLFTDYIMPERTSCGKPCCWVKHGKLWWQSEGGHIFRIKAGHSRSTNTLLIKSVSNAVEDQSISDFSIGAYHFGVCKEKGIRGTGSLFLDIEGFPGNRGTLKGQSIWKRTSYYGCLFPISCLPVAWLSCAWAYCGNTGTPYC